MFGLYFHITFGLSSENVRARTQGRNTSVGLGGMLVTNFLRIDSTHIGLGPPTLIINQRSPQIDYRPSSESIFLVVIPSFQMPFFWGGVVVVGNQVDQKISWDIIC